MSVPPTSSPSSPRPRRILLLGATGTIGRATAAALLARGHEVVCPVRPRAAGSGLPRGVVERAAQVTDPVSLAREAIRGERFDALVSCLATRHGAPDDAWAVEHRAPAEALRQVRAAGATQVVLLSAICVQKPRLVFQHAKLALEAEVIASGLEHSIVRPTAYFKSLSGQVERVRQGGAFLVFGDGRRTACKPIADEDLADYLAGCLDDPARRNRVLPVGGPGDAITPRKQGEMLAALLGRPVRFRSVPVALLDGVAGTLGGLARLWPALAPKAEFARIGRYYATESMLVLDPTTGRYDAAATPSHGRRTLREHYAALLAGQARHTRGEHAVF